MIQSLQGWYFLATAPDGPMPVYVYKVDAQKRVAFYWRLQPAGAHAPRVIHGDAPFHYLRHLTGERVVIETRFEIGPGCKMFSTN